MIGKGWFPEQTGGLDRYFTHLARELADIRGVEVMPIVVGAVSDDEVGVRGVAGHEAPLVRRLLAVSRACRDLKPPDVVDVHFALYAALPTLLGRLRHVPLCLHFHGPWADENRAAGDSSRVRHCFRRRLERAVYRRAARTVVLTGAFRRVLVERYRVSPWTIEVDPPGVDLARFSPGDRVAARQSLDLADGDFVVCAVRRLVPRMGLRLLLSSWASLLGQLGRPGVLLVVGVGPLRTSLEEYAAELGIAHAVRFLGRVHDDELPDVYRAADANVLPTIALEGFGLVVLEAAACGTPSIVTDVGGLPEAVRDLDPSLIVRGGSTTALADRLISAATGANELPSRERTRAYAEHFSWGSVAARAAEYMRRPPTRRLRVVYLDHTARLSGGELALLRLLPHLDGVQPHVVLAEDGPLADALVAAGVSVEVIAMGERGRDVRKADVGLRLSPLALASSVLYVVRLARRLRQLDPDLVHTNSLKSGLYGCAAARLARVPVVWHVRDRISDDYLPRGAVRLVRWMVRRQTDAVIANSRTTLATINVPAVSAVIYSVVPRVVEAGHSFLRVPEDGNGLVFGMVGRIALWKGQDLFIEAFARAFPRGPNRAVIIGAPMFGKDEAQFAADLSTRVRQLGLVDRLEFRGFCSDVWSQLSKIDVLVHASKTPEPLGQVVLEGMAAGLPVIASRAGGPEELITHGVNGMLSAPGDVGALAEALVELASSADLRCRLSTAARERACEFLPDRISPQVISLYHQVVARRTSETRLSGRIKG